MKHVCIDARLFGIHGIGTYLKNFLPFLAKEPSIELTLLHYPKDLEALAPLSSRSIFMKTPIYSIKEQLELSFKVPRCDLFWSPHFNVPLLPILARKRLVTIHDVYHLFSVSTRSFIENCYVKLFYNAALAYSDFVITDSHFSKKEIERLCLLKPKNMKIISQSPRVFLKSTPISLQKKLPGKYLLYVGRIVIHKNLFRLIQAYETLRPEYPLVIVGSYTPYQETLLSYVKRSSFLCKAVHFVGSVEDADLPEIYRRAELFIFPSYYEGFGLPPLEAMAFDCPVVASKTASIPEICGDAAEYIDPYSVDSICEGIMRLLKDKAKKQELIEKGRERVKYYAPEKTAKKLIEAIDVCCGCS